MFDVIVNGKIATATLDLIIPVTTKISGDSVTIELIPLRENPKLCAIEVLEVTNYVEPPTSAPVAQPFLLLINCGGNNFIKAIGGRTWTADQYFIGGMGQILSPILWIIIYIKQNDMLNSDMKFQYLSMEAMK